MFPPVSSCLFLYPPPLTERVVKAAGHQGPNSLLIRDDEISGFGLRVYSNGARGFFLDYRFGSRQRAMELRRRIDQSRGQAVGHAA